MPLCPLTIGAPLARPCFYYWAAPEWDTASSVITLKNSRKLENQTKIEVDTVILDDYFKNSTTRVDFIKIDVECSELKVLTGLQKTLKNNDNLKILIEYSYPCRETFNTEPNDNMKFLSEYGFHFSDATYKDATVFFDYDYLVSKYTNSWINFFCVKK